MLFCDHEVSVNRKPLCKLAAFIVLRIQIDQAIPTPHPICSYHQICINKYPLEQLRRVQICGLVFEADHHLLITLVDIDLMNTLLVRRLFACIIETVSDALNIASAPRWRRW